MPPIPCPSCGAPLPAQPVQCPACRLPLIGPDAARLWELDQRLAALRTERAQVLLALRTTGVLEAGGVATAAGSGADVLASSSPTPAGPTPTPVTAPPVTAPPVTAPPADIAPPAAPPAAAAPRRRWTTQQTLLGVGVLLVLVASSIALAVAWFLIGPYGQMVVMGGLTAVAAGVSLRLSRRGLSSSAEALALVAGGLLLLDTTAARRFGLLGLAGLDSRPYATVTGLLVACLLAALHRRDRRIAAFALLSLTSASIAWAGVVALADDPAPVAALSLLGASVFGAARLLLPESLGLTRRAAAGPASGWVVLAFLAAAAGALAGAEPGGPSSVTFSGAVSVGLLLLVCAAGAEVVRRVVAARAAVLGSRAAVRADWSARALTGDWRALGVVAVTATLAAPTAVLSFGLQVGATGTAVLAVLVAAVGAGLLVLRRPSRSLGDLWLLGELGLAQLLLVVVGAAHGADVATTITLLAVASVATTAAARRPAWRAVASGVAALALLGAVALASGLGSPVVQVFALTALGLALTATALARPARAEEVPVAAVAVLAFALALAGATGQRLPDGVTATVLAAVTVAATATAVLRPRGRSVASGVGALALLGAVALASGLVSPTTQALAVTALAVVLASAALARPHRAEELPVAAVAGLGFVLALVTSAGQQLPEAVTATVLAALAATAAVAAVLRPAVRPAAEGLAAVSGTAAVWLAGGLVSPEVQWTLLALTATALAALSAWRRGALDELVLGSGAVLTSFAAVAVALDHGWPHAAAGAAAAYGLVAVGYAALPHRRAVVTAAVLGLTTAVWLELLEAEVTRLEAYTVPLALVLLAAGLWSHRELGDRSWAVAGPALAVGLLPSALATAVGDDLARALVTVTLGAAVLALGAWRRWQALVVLGAAAAALVAVTQLGPVTLHAPRYLTLGTVGVALLLVGARYEQSRAGARQAVSWLSQMS
ncbi:zinc ribbon domain-containing protein [Phycicoccus sp. Root101]|uniref:zinc ribbon domain-containing protein n=1 Tax=Phycicoccus sp. Root101 TaxID=1736421 RepID=UPI0007037C3D|nr:zinc ribbon domain-containing protein [Phycicoccus sp. Root101]KQU70338.1 hypothetical protein ASC58_00465 [Phycicoccus sp. Root101]